MRCFLLPFLMPLEMTQKKVYSYYMQHKVPHKTKDFFKYFWPLNSMLLMAFKAFIFAKSIQWLLWLFNALQKPWKHKFLLRKPFLLAGKMGKRHSKASIWVWKKGKTKRVSPLPLVVREVHGTDACVTAWVDVELFEVTGLPHLHHSVVTSCHQVLAVAAQQHRLRGQREAGGRWERDAMMDTVVLGGITAASLTLAASPVSSRWPPFAPAVCR